MSALYTVVEFEPAYIFLKLRYPKATEYLEKSTVKEKWAKCCFPGERYNLDTRNTVESLNKTFKEARRYALIPLLDTILKRLSKWFNEHWKKTVAGTDDNKLVPLVENHVHDLWIQAESLIFMVFNSFELLYDVIDSDEKPYLVNLMSKSCSCRFFDIERYLCVHALAAFIKLKKDPNRPKDRDMELHELSLKYYWMELWALAYYRTIYLVSDMSEWDVPDDIRNLQILPPDKPKTKGRKKTNRCPSAREKRKKKKRTHNKRRPRKSLQWLMFGRL